MDHQSRAVNGSVKAGLDKVQRQKLAVIAADAWVAQGRPGYKSFGGPTRMAAFDAWRHQVALGVVGRESFRTMTQGDYAPLMAEFSRRAGKVVSADYWAKRGATEPSRQALYILRREMNRVRDVIGDPDAYVITIARSKFKTGDLCELAERQLWTLVFDLRRGAQRKRKEFADAVPF